jgi:hypothetical protein
MTYARTFLAIVLVGAVGCGSSEQQQAEDAAKSMGQAAEQIAKGAEQMTRGGADAGAQMAQGFEAMAKGFQQMSQSQASPVDFEVLEALLPDVPGWTKGTPKGEQMNQPVKYSRARVQYDKGDASIDLEISDSALNQLLLAPMSMFLASGFSERSSEGFKRSAQVGGYPGFEEWRNAGKDGEVTVVVANRFIVKADGTNVASLDEVKGVVTAVNLAKLASQK